MYQTILGINNWKYMKIICGLKINLEGIFAVMNTTYAVVKILLEKNSGLNGI